MATVNIGAGEIMSTTSGGRLRRFRRVLAAATGALLVVELLGAATAGAHPAIQDRHNKPAHPLPRADWKYVAPYTFLASLKARAPGFSGPNDNSRKLTVPKTWYGHTTVMPITNANHTRVKVRLARRPDESQVWLRRRAVKIGVTVYDLVLDLSNRRLYMFKLGRQVGSYPVGEGLPRSPTPTGTYFIAFHADPNGPGYGQVMLETSAHSKVFRTFEGSNDAIIAIHGPITPESDAAIGNSGTRISNGCIRMHDSQLLKVAWVPDGTPISIVQ